jgi:probable F420-dependent oxidoreductase
MGDLIATVRLAEELGFYTVALPEHLLPPSPETTPDWAKIWYDQAVLAAFFAAHTEKISLMPGVHVTPYHPPVQAAKALATVDVVSGGRLRLAAGVGWYKEEFEQLGLPYEERGDMTDEYLLAMKELWTADQPRFAGKYVSFEDVSFLPRPSGIPIIIGGLSQRALRRVAEYGDGWYPMTDSPDTLRSGIARIREHLRAVGREDSSQTVICSLNVEEDPQLAILRRHVHMAEEGSMGVMTPDPGLADHSGRLSPAACVEEIRRLADAGATELMVKFAWRDSEDLRGELRWFSTEVMPKLKE